MQKSVPFAEISAKVMGVTLYVYPVMLIEIVMVKCAVPCSIKRCMTSTGHIWAAHLSVSGH